MNDFILYPAIDLRNGEVVRLKQGDPTQQTTYGYDPGSTARRWIEAGAQWLHVVNLDGAFGESSGRNLLALSAIVEVAAGSNVQVQFGGGLRTLKDLESALTLGVTRTILGTSAAQKPEIIGQAVSRFGPQAVSVGVDARDGIVKIQGWQESGSLTALELGVKAAASGIQTIVYTNIARDGVGTGVDLEGTKILAAETGLVVIASGGVASISDIALVREAGLPGVIIGRALYEGQVDLIEALRC